MKKHQKLAIAAMLMSAVACYADDPRIVIKEGSVSVGGGEQNRGGVGSLSMRHSRSHLVLKSDHISIEEQTFVLELHGGDTYLRLNGSSDLYPVSLIGGAKKMEKYDGVSVLSLLIVPNVEIDALRGHNGIDAKNAQVFVSGDVVAQLFLKGEGKPGSGFSNGKLWGSSKAFTVEVKARAGIGAGALAENNLSGGAVVAHGGAEVEALYVRARVTADIFGKGSQSIKGLQFLGKAKYVRALEYQSTGEVESEWSRGRKLSGEVNYLFNTRNGNKLWTVGVKGEANRFNMTATDPSVEDRNSGRVYYVGGQLGVKY